MSRKRFSSNPLDDSGTSILADCSLMDSFFSQTQALRTQAHSFFTPNKASTSAVSTTARPANAGLFEVDDNSFSSLLNSNARAVTPHNSKDSCQGFLESPDSPSGLSAGSQQSSRSLSPSDRGLQLRGNTTVIPSSNIIAPFDFNRFYFMNGSLQCVSCALPNGCLMDIDDVTPSGIVDHVTKHHETCSMDLEQAEMFTDLMDLWTSATHENIIEDAYICIKCGSTNTDRSNLRRSCKTNECVDPKTKSCHYIAVQMESFLHYPC